MSFTFSAVTNTIKTLNFLLITRILFAILFIYTILIMAWVSDDSQITLRQVWNFITGHGITFNFEERVQAFTHPLWFLILSEVIFCVT